MLFRIISNKFINFVNPERETFKEFIFRDSKGLFKYEGIYPSLTKNYLDISDNYNLENLEISKADYITKLKKDFSVEPTMAKTLIKIIDHDVD